MAFSYTAPDWQQLRELTYRGDDDTQLYLDLGHFIARFAIAELGLTTLLAKLTGSHDPVTFDLLVKGMDARVKVERIRKAIALRKLAHPSFIARLDVFEEDIITLRNQLTHSSIATTEGIDPPSYFLFGLSNLPWDELGEAAPIGMARAGKPTVVASQELYSAAYWLWLFAEDIRTASARATRGETLRIESPRSPLPKGSREDRRQQAERARVDKLARKAAQRALAARQKEGAR